MIDSFFTRRFYKLFWLIYCGVFIGQLIAFGLALAGGLLLSQREPVLPIWAIATLGNVLGLVLNYVLGVYASDWVKPNKTRNLG